MMSRVTEQKRSSISTGVRAAARASRLEQRLSPQSAKTSIMLVSHFLWKPGVTARPRTWSFDGGANA